MSTEGNKGFPVAYSREFAAAHHGLTLARGSGEQYGYLWHNLSLPRGFFWAAHLFFMRGAVRALGEIE